MSVLWEDLCDALAEELERQETLRAVCEAQNAALRAGNVSRVQETAASLDALTREARHAEQRRIALTARIACVHGLETPMAPLRELVALAPEPWRSRMEYYRERICEIGKTVRALLRENELRAKRSAHVVQRCLELFTPNRQVLDGRYDRRGTTATSPHVVPALLDARG